MYYYFKTHSYTNLKRLVIQKYFNDLPRLRTHVTCNLKKIPMFL